jgi:hypothetical protein
VLDTPGYDAETGLVFDSKGLKPKPSEFS